MTPDEDVTLFLHCHLPAHDKVGMVGKLIVGSGGAPRVAQAQRQAEARLHKGVGVVIAAVPRAGRLIVDHEAIPGFMAAMEMSFQVDAAVLARGLNPGDKIGFTIDAGKSAIVAIDVIEQAK